jgi:hypothetical protein
VCSHYAEIKRDYLYRGDVLDAVPFVSLDARDIRVEAPPSKDIPSYYRADFIPERDHPQAGKAELACVAKLERLPGVVILRTCEANKRPKQRKVFGSVLVAPIRPFDSFALDQHTQRPFHELVLEGFPADDPSEPPGECYRFMLLPLCQQHGLPKGGMICFREMQPVPISHLLSCKRVTRLGLEMVGALDQRIAMYLQQSDDDNEKDAAPLEADSEIVAAHKKRQEMQVQRASESARST